MSSKKSMEGPSALFDRTRNTKVASRRGQSTLLPLRSRTMEHRKSSAAFLGHGRRDDEKSAHFDGEGHRKDRVQPRCAHTMKGNGNEKISHDSNDEGHQKDHVWMLSALLKTCRPDPPVTSWDEELHKQRNENADESHQMGASQLHRAWNIKGKLNKFLLCLTFVAVVQGLIKMLQLGTLTSSPQQSTWDSLKKKPVKWGVKKNPEPAEARAKKDVAMQIRVSCGNHDAPTCEDCPQKNGRAWCHGECMWSMQSGMCISRDSSNTKTEWTKQESFQADGNSARKVNGATSLGTLAPRLPLLSVDDHFAWLHIAKTGTSFVNALYFFACQHGPSNLPLGSRHINDFEDLTSKPEHQCRKEYSRNPKLTASHNLEHASFHQKLTQPVFEHNKGKLIGMLREPREHRISLIKHKYLNKIRTKSWLEFTSRNGLPSDDRRLSTFLQFTRGFMTEFLVGSNMHQNKKRDRDLVNLAKDRLTEGFQYVGITNRWEESVGLFYFKFFKAGDVSSTHQSCPPVVFEALNTASHHVPAFNFTKEDLKYFETFDDEMDREVYNHALQLFEADLHLYGVTRETCAAKGCWPPPRNEREKERAHVDGELKAKPHRMHS